MTPDDALFNRDTQPTGDSPLLTDMANLPSPRGRRAEYVQTGMAAQGEAPLARWRERRERDA
jgi:hypothetical protein